MWHFVGLEAQTVYVNGTVRDAQGKPLGQVLCKLLSARDSLLTYVVTRPTGAYRLPVKQGGTPTRLLQDGVCAGAVGL